MTSSLDRKWRMVMSGSPASTKRPSSSVRTSLTSPFCGAQMGFSFFSRVSLARSVPGFSCHLPPGPATRSPGPRPTKRTTPVCGVRISISS